MTVNDSFLVMGIIIVASFAGSVLFKKTRIPNPILLIGIGIGLGFWAGFDKEAMQGIAPIFGSLALMLILLEAGMELHLSHFFQNIGRALLFGFLAFLSGLAACYAVLHYVFGLIEIQALILASVTVGASPTILVPVLKGMTMVEEEKAFFDLECTVTEVLGLILTVILVPFIATSLQGGGLDLFEILRQAGKKLSGILIYALIFPTILGLVWSRILKSAGEQPLWSILTIGMTLLLFGLSENLGGKGALNVLVFGLVLGNAGIIFKQGRRLIKRFLANRRIERFALGLLIGHRHADIHSVSRELSFLVRTFFFVYLGAMVDFSLFTKEALLLVLALTLLPILLRFILAALFQKKLEAVQNRIAFVGFMSPKGLANAVAAFSVISGLAAMPLPDTVKASWKATLITPVFGVILASNLLMTFYLIFRKEGQLIQPGLENG